METETSARVERHGEGSPKQTTVCHPGGDDDSRKICVGFRIVLYHVVFVLMVIDVCMYADARQSCLLTQFYAASVQLKLDFSSHWY